MNFLDNITLMERLLRAAVEQTARSLSRLEGLLFGDGPPRFPPVFIVGPPRSGTTLVYQAMCHCFQLAYTPMLANYLPFAPALATWLARRPGGYESDFTSRYGAVRGLGSPGEGTMWNVWFEKDRHYRHPGELERRKAQEIVRLVGRIERISAGPFINKNLRNENRLPVLASLLPRAVFLMVLRNPRDVALSILRGRIEMRDDPELWFSIKPRSGAPEGHQRPEEQVVLQIAGILDDLREDIGRIGPNRFGAVRYEDFCDSPPAFMRSLSGFLNDRGVPVEVRREPPGRFEASRGRTNKLSPDQVANVDGVLSTVFSGDPLADFPCQWIRPGG